MVPSRRPLFPSLRRKACLKLAGFESLDILRLSMSDLYRRILDLESGPYTRWNVIPNIETVATYSFNTQTIELCDIGSEEYRKSLAGDIALQRKITVLLAHEIRHWLDHVGALLGQQVLCLGYKAINAPLLNRTRRRWAGGCGSTKCPRALGLIIQANSASCTRFCSLGFLGKITALPAVCPCRLLPYLKPPQWIMNCALHRLLFPCSTPRNKEKRPKLSRAGTWTWLTIQTWRNIPSPFTLYQTSWVRRTVPVHFSSRQYLRVSL